MKSPRALRQEDHRRVLAHLLLCILLITLSYSAHALPKTVAERLAEYETLVKRRLKPCFEAAAAQYPPPRLTFIAFKQERQLQVYVSATNGGFRLLRSYPILAASGHLGPKLRQGDDQVPEGLYRIVALNPNSAFHLSMRINYPNEFDRAQAKADGRTNLGGDIMIHGDAVSIGCVAVGDQAAEDLFVLAARTGLPKTKVILSPVDFRLRGLPEPKAPVPQWVAGLYRKINVELANYPLDRQNVRSPPSRSQGGKGRSQTR